jgi:hypothetical protein
MEVLTAQCVHSTDRRRWNRRTTVSLGIAQNVVLVLLRARAGLATPVIARGRLGTGRGWPGGACGACPDAGDLVDSE